MSPEAILSHWIHQLTFNSFRQALSETKNYATMDRPPPFDAGTQLLFSTPAFPPLVTPTDETDEAHVISTHHHHTE